MKVISIPCLLLLHGVFLHPTLAQDEQLIEPEKVAIGRPISFATDILPILRANCIACHNETTNENELVLETVSAIRAGGAEGPSVVPGKPDESLIYLVAARSTEPVMPPLPNDAKAKALTPRELGLLRQWIVEGAVAPPSDLARTMKWRPVNQRLQAVHCVDYHEPTGIIAASRGSRVELYDLHRRRRVGSLSDPALTGGIAHRDVVQSVAFHPKDAILATGGYRTVKFWRRGSAVVGQRAFKKPVDAHATNRRSIAVAVGRELRIFTSLSNSSPRILQVTEPVVAIALAKDSGRVFAGHKSGVVTYWEANATTPSGVIELGIEPTCLLPFSDRIAAGTADGRVLLAAMDGTTPPAEAKVHTARLTRMCAVGDQTLFTASEDGTIAQWNIPTRKLIRRIKAAGPVTSLAVSPDAKHVAAATVNGPAAVWDIASGKQSAVCDKDLKYTQSLAEADLLTRIHDRKVSDRTNKVNAAKAEVDAQTKTLSTAKQTEESSQKAAAATQAKLAAADSKLTADRAASIAKPDDKNLKGKLDASTKAKDGLAASNSKAQRALANATKDVAIVEKILKRAKRVHTDQQARLQAMTRERDEARSRLQQLKQNQQPIPPPVSIAFESDRVLTTVDTAGHIRSWESATGEPLSVLQTGTRPTSAVPTERGFAALVAGRQQIKLLTTVPDWVPQASPLPKESIVGRVRAIDFSRDGRWLAVGSGQPSRSGQLQIWDATSRKLAHEIEGAHSDTVLDVEFSTDSRLLLSCGSDKFAKSWSVADGRFVQSYEGHTHHVLTASWQPDMTRVATGGGDNQIKLWDAETGEQRRTITTHSKHVTGLHFHGAADGLISCSGDRTVRSFTTANGRAIRSFPGISDYTHCVTTTLSGAFVVAGSEDGIVRVWNGLDGKPITQFEPTQSD